MTSFEQLGIAPQLLRAITEMGFEQPTPVQAEVIPVLLQKRTDIIALAKTGTGKTAAFGLPLLQNIKAENRYPQALILCPTRELCLQIADDFADYIKFSESLRVVPVYGGASIENQIQLLKKGAHIIVATPGRLIDLIDRKVAKLDKVERVVLDEADEMLNMGFSESIDQILSHLPIERNIMLFSATMPTGIRAIASKYMHEPIEITVGRKNEGAENVKHIAYTVHAKDKYLALKRLADYVPDIYGIVFCRTRRETQEVAEKLIQDGYNADSLHGDLSQAQRDAVMNKFRIRNTQLLVATDVAARGIDVDDLTHVINYNLPDDPEVYTHRSGRTGRAGKKGTSVAIVNLKEKHVIRQIEKIINKQFSWAKVPSGREVCEKQLFHMIDKLEKVEIDQNEIESYLPMVFKKLEWLDKEELITRLVSLEFSRFIEYYRNAVDINQNEGSARGEGRSRGEGGNVAQASRKGFTRLFINLGKSDGLFPNTLIDFINKCTPGTKVPVGKIDLYDKFSFFEVDKNCAEYVASTMSEAKFGKRRVAVDLSQEKGGEPRHRDERKDGFRRNKKRDRY